VVDNRILHWDSDKELNFKQHMLDKKRREKKQNRRLAKKYKRAKDEKEDDEDDAEILYSFKQQCGVDFN
jgi:hypothetical protein